VETGRYPLPHLEAKKIHAGSMQLRQRMGSL